ncbi:MAG: DUF3618 domain-containing protein [Steroidobacteraceae bacterium]|nr:DUF3618 domain-containing protein [Steroidobacteraceae bacterium]
MSVTRDDTRLHGAVGAGDTETLERNIDVTRSEVRGTLDALQARLSPGQLVDRAFSFMRDNGGEFAGNLGTSVKQHPLPVLLTGVGLLWMMMSRNAPPGASRGYATARKAGVEAEGLSDESLVDLEQREGLSDDNIDGPSTTADGGEDGGIRQRVSGAASGIASRLSGAASGARERMHGMAGSVSGGASAVSQRMSGAAQSARSQARRAGEGFNDLLYEQPLLVGALGVAVGALIGAALPTTETEDRALGDTRDRLMQRAKDVGAEQYSKAREFVSETAGERPATPH